MTIIYYARGFCGPALWTGHSGTAPLPHQGHRGLQVLLFRGDLWKAELCWNRCQETYPWLLHAVWAYPNMLPGFWRELAVRDQV